MTHDDSELLLSAVGITVHFGGVTALADVPLELRAGRCTGLVGENGAGKSTLAKVICGLQNPSEGTVFVRGEHLALGHPQSAQAKGVAIVPQEPAILPNLTVSENIAVGNRPRKFGPVLSWRKSRRNAVEVLERIGAQFSPDELAGGLSVAEKHLLSLARALSMNPKILILDEVTASLSPIEAEHMFGVVDELLLSGAAVVLVTHRLAEIRRLADDILVLRDGRLVANRQMADTTTDEIVQLMLGRAIKEVYPKSLSEPGPVALEVRGLSRHGYFEDIDLTVRKGEIVGLAGLVGAGRSEFGRSLIGIDPLDEGEVFIDSEPYRPVSPREAMKRGLVYVPEDRANDGLITSTSIRRNISLAVLPEISPWQFVRNGEEKTLARTYMDRLSVKAASAENSVATLSGGNQQKVLLGKWLATRPNLVVLDEPTRGVDVGTKAEIHRRVSDLAADGLAVLMISSDLEEVLAMSDRVVTFFEGSVSGEFHRGSGFDAETVLRAMNGLQGVA